MATEVLHVNELRNAENYLIEKCNMPSLLLMENAGKAVADSASETLLDTSTIFVACGMGKNGGDGLVAARHLALMGHKIIVWMLGNPQKMKQDVKIMYDALVGMGIPIYIVADQRQLKVMSKRLDGVDIIIDAIFGIGLNRQLEMLEISAIQLINRLKALVYSVSMPSGIHADTGEIMGEAIKAERTITFFAMHPGHLLFPGREYCGELQCINLSRRSAFELSGSNIVNELMNPSDIPGFLPKRKLNSNKGNYGKGLLIGGSMGMGGSICLSALATVRSGLGLLTVAMPKSTVNVLWTGLPEVMCYPMPEENGCFSKDVIEQLKVLIKGKNAVAVGPGMGKNDSVFFIVEWLLQQDINLVIDADALNAFEGRVDCFKNTKAEIVLTPHPGEMARLCGLPIEEILKDPIGYSQALAKRINATILLKGATSIIVAPNTAVTFNISGTPKLAKGGSGDALCGIILALLGQGMSSYDAARYAALILGVASDMTYGDEKGIITRDIIEKIPLVLMMN